MLGFPPVTPRTSVGDQGWGARASPAPPAWCFYRRVGLSPRASAKDGWRALAASLAALGLLPGMGGERWELPLSPRGFCLGRGVLGASPAALRLLPVTGQRPLRVGVGVILLPRLPSAAAGEPCQSSGARAPQLAMAPGHGPCGQSATAYMPCLCWQWHVGYK